MQCTFLALVYTLLKSSLLAVVVMQEDYDNDEDDVVQLFHSYFKVCIAYSAEAASAAQAQFSPNL